MSASREKKSRQESLAGGYVDPRTKREKDEQAKDRRSNALYIAIAVIFVIVGIVVTVANSKVIERNAFDVTTANETYTAADVSYFYNTIYSSFVSKNSYYLSAYGLDTSKSLKEQDCPVTDGGTWYDYFRDQALSSMTCSRRRLRLKALTAARKWSSPYRIRLPIWTLPPLPPVTPARSTSRPCAARWSTRRSSSATCVLKPSLRPIPPIM